MAKKKQTLLQTKKTMSGMHMLLYALVFGLIGGVISYAAFAAPAPGKGKPGGGGGSGGGSLSLVMVTDTNGDGMPNFKDSVSFKVTSSSVQPYVRVECTQNSTLVYTETNGFFAGYPWDTNFDLGPTQSWTSGPANCIAKLIVLNNSKQTVQASLSFLVNG
jgi:hypothetical protein